MTKDGTQSSKHTPGPWSRSIDDGQTGWVKASEGTIIAKVPSAGWDDTQWLNHRLIAAAPEMLEAMDKLLGEAYYRAAKEGRPYTEAEAQASAAISKAEPIKPDERPLDTSAILALE